MSRISSFEILLLWSGAHQFGLRWKIVKWPTVFAISWIACTAVAPVPMIPTRLPVKSMPSFGQLCVWQDWPLNDSIPGMLFGIVGAERTPIAVIRNRVV